MKSPRKIIYIAGPYTHGDMAQNVADHMTAAHRVMDMGGVPIVPVLSHYLHIHHQRPYHEWLDADLVLLARADAVWRLPGHSPGADEETRHASMRQIPVFTTPGDVMEFIRIRRVPVGF